VAYIDTSNIRALSHIYTIGCIANLIAVIQANSFGIQFSDLDHVNLDKTIQ
jgi:hypothetical protein